jgi:hypothetical protein
MSLYGTQKIEIDRNGLEGFNLGMVDRGLKIATFEVITTMLSVGGVTEFRTAIDSIKNNLTNTGNEIKLEDKVSERDLLKIGEVIKPLLGKDVQPGFEIHIGPPDADALVSAMLLCFYLKHLDKESSPSIVIPSTHLKPLAALSERFGFTLETFLEKMASSGFLLETESQFCKRAREKKQIP